MNPIAQELNERLQGSCAEKLLSDFGKRFYFPKGIAAQSAEAKRKAHHLNATIGMAYENGHPMMLSPVCNALPGFTAEEAVEYAPTGGDAKLRAAWRQEIVKKNPGVDSDKLSNPIVVSGLTNGLSLLGDLFVDERDTVIMPDMFWGNYRLIFEERRLGKIVTFPFYAEDGSLNVKGFEATARTIPKGGKVILLVNFPNNPTGYSPSKSEADALAESINRLAEDGYSVLVIADDAYFGLFFEDDTCDVSIFAKTYALHENVLAVKVDGATKEDFVWGFRVGFVTFASKGMSTDALEALTLKLQGAVRASVSNCSRPAQSIVLKALGDGSYGNEKLEKFDILKKRYEAVNKIIDERETGSSLSPLPFNSGYFMSFAFSGGSAEELRVKLLEEKGIGTISIQDKFLRIAYASIDEADLFELYSEVFKTADEVAGS